MTYFNFDSQFSSVASQSLIDLIPNGTYCIRSKRSDSYYLDCTNNRVSPSSSLIMAHRRKWVDFWFTVYLCSTHLLWFDLHIFWCRWQLRDQVPCWHLGRQQLESFGLRGRWPEFYLEHRSLRTRCIIYVRLLYIYASHLIEIWNWIRIGDATNAPVIELTIIGLSPVSVFSYSKNAIKTVVFHKLWLIFGT